MLQLHHMFISDPNHCGGQSHGLVRWVELSLGLLWSGNRSRFQQDFLPPYSQWGRWYLNAPFKGEVFIHKGNVLMKEKI